MAGGGYDPGCRRTIQARLTIHLSTRKRPAYQEPELTGHQAGPDGELDATEGATAEAVVTDKAAVAHPIPAAVFGDKEI